MLICQLPIYIFLLSRNVDSIILPSSKLVCFSLHIVNVKIFFFLVTFLIYIKQHLLTFSRYACKYFPLQSHTCYLIFYWLFYLFIFKCYSFLPSFPSINPLSHFLSPCFYEGAYPPIHPPTTNTPTKQYPVQGPLAITRPKFSHPIDTR